MSFKRCKHCEGCKRTLRTENKSGLCQACYLKVYQMMKCKKKIRSRKECIEECRNINSNIYKGECIN